ncbi:MAG: dienelactone hydrolase family protein [Bradyrhizobium sp.]|nr:dienelactone hydrolase family protein [Bradyrhizobium sp.]MDU6726978.1 dienelactone hydrolase family protein [Bradyrhizobium sp.]
MNRFCIAALSVWLTCCAPCFGQNASHVLLIPFATTTSADNDVLMGQTGGTPATIAGELRLPRSQDPAFPAVILIPSSDGGNLAVERWANALNKQGIATFTVDSFSGRRFNAGKSQVDPPTQRLFQIPDAYRALDLLAKHPRIDASRIALMGFGTGGVVALYGRLERFRKAFSTGSARIALFIGLYTPCNISLVDETEPSQASVRLFHGSSDDWFPVSVCRDYVAKLSNANIDIVLREYPNAYNSFDNPDLKHQVFLSQFATARGCRLEERARGDFVNRDTGKAFEPKDACVTRGVTFGYDREAAAIARSDVTAALAKIFDLTPQKDD